MDNHQCPGCWLRDQESHYPDGTVCCICYVLTGKFLLTHVGLHEHGVITFKQMPLYYTAKDDAELRTLFVTIVRDCKCRSKD